MKTRISTNHRLRKKTLITLLDLMPLTKHIYMLMYPLKKVSEYHNHALRTPMASREETLTVTIHQESNESQSLVRKQPIIALYFDTENELKFYNLEACSHFSVNMLAKQEWHIVLNT